MDTVFTLKSRTLIATARAVPKGFVVTAGSEAARRPRTIDNHYRALREALIASGVLANHPSDADKLVFTCDHRFSSASAAATVAHAQQSNGLTCWVGSNGAVPVRRYAHKKRWRPTAGKRLAALAVHVDQYDREWSGFLLWLSKLLAATDVPAPTGTR